MALKYLQNLTSDYDIRHFPDIWHLKHWIYHDGRPSRSTTYKDLQPDGDPSMAFLKDGGSPILDAWSQPITGYTLVTARAGQTPIRLPAYMSIHPDGYPSRSILKDRGSSALDAWGEPSLGPTAMVPRASQHATSDQHENTTSKLRASPLGLTFAGTIGERTSFGDHISNHYKCFEPKQLSEHTP